MADQQVILHLPPDVYEQIKQDADQQQRSVEEVLLNRVIARLRPEPRLPHDFQTLVDQLAFLDDTELWRAARRRMDVKDAHRLEQLHFKLQREGLDKAELQESQNLTKIYEQVMLVRARAAQLLHQRGYDVSSLGPKAPNA